MLIHGYCCLFVYKWDLLLFTGKTVWKRADDNANICTYAFTTYDMSRNLYWNKLICINVLQKQFSSKKNFDDQENFAIFYDSPTQFHVLSCFAKLRIPYLGTSQSRLTETFVRAEKGIETWIKRTWKYKLNW